MPEHAIAIIPDEQDAIAAALQMGRSGDLVMIFADALARSPVRIWNSSMYGPSRRSRSTRSAFQLGARRSGGVP